MFDWVHCTESNGLCSAVINMISHLLSVQVLTQPRGHPVSGTVGCWGVIGQPKVLTDGRLSVRWIVLQLGHHTKCNNDTLTIDKPLNFKAPHPFQTIRGKSIPALKVKMPASLLLLCRVCAAYFNVQILMICTAFICMCIVLQACGSLALCWDEEGCAGGGRVKWVWRAQCAASVERKVVWYGGL